jgi:hypothetical protein
LSSYILDANVAAKWFLPPASEPLVQEALRLLKGFAEGHIGLFVPAAIGSLSELNLPTSPAKPLLPDAYSIAATFERTVYDSIYVALAVVSDRLLVTADERLANSLAAHFPVRWLGSIP